MDQSIYYGISEGEVVVVSQQNRFIHTSITVETQDQRDQALIMQVSQDLDRLTLGQPSVSIVITESESQQKLLRGLTSEHDVLLHTVNNANIADINFNELYTSGGVMLVNFEVPVSEKEALYENFLEKLRIYIFNTEKDNLIPTFLVVDQSIQYMFQEKVEDDDRKHNWLEIILVVGRSRFIGVTLLFDTETVSSAMMKNNIFNAFRFNTNHQWINSDHWKLEKKTKKHQD